MNKPYDLYMLSPLCVSAKQEKPLASWKVLDQFGNSFTVPNSVFERFFTPLEKGTPLYSLRCEIKEWEWTKTEPYTWSASNKNTSNPQLKILGSWALYAQEIDHDHYQYRVEFDGKRLKCGYAENLEEAKGKAIEVTARFWWAKEA